MCFRQENGYLSRKYLWLSCPQLVSTLVVRRSLTPSTSPWGNLSQSRFAISESFHLKVKFENLSKRNKSFENLFQDNKAALELAQKLRTQNAEKDALIGKLASSKCNSLKVRNKKVWNWIKGGEQQTSDHKDTQKLLEISESKLLKQSKMAEEEREKLDVKVKFLQDSVISCTEETLIYDGEQTLWG